jgi:hypothetical protein
MGKPWKQSEIDWLKDNYSILSNKALAAFLCRTVASIQQKAFRLGIKLPEIIRHERAVESGLRAFEKINGGFGEDNLNKRGKRKSNKEYKQIQNIRFPGKNAARDVTRYAIKMGVIVKTPCIVCGCVEVEAHHDDYSKPLEVIFLCKKHHRELHRNKEVQ